MQETFAELLTAYLAASLFFQTEWSRQRIWNSGIQRAMYRGAIITLTSYVLLGAFHWKLLLLVLVTHLILEVTQAFLLSDSIASFLANQGARLSACFILAVYFSAAAGNGWWVTKFDPQPSQLYFVILSWASGIILCVPAGGVLIAKVIGPLAEEIRDFEIAGLRRGGQYIGWLERSLVMLLVLADQPNSIGFLIAAKSILRFGEIKDASQRKVTEYIIIGTFLSFGWALLISLLTQKTLKYWMP